MSDRRIDVSVDGDWHRAFHVILSALHAVGVNLAHPTENCVFFLPFNGDERREFNESEDSKESGAIQSWITETEDVIVGWVFEGEFITFSVYLDGIGIEKESNILKSLYRAFRENSELLRDELALKVYL